MDSSLVQFDRGLLIDCSFTCLPMGAKIDFQFPPKITSEGNSSEWETKDVWSIEQLKIHKGSGGKKMSMEWEYIATDSKWNADAISLQLKLLKGYFFKFNENQYPVCIIKYGKVIPQPIKFRLMDVQITYSEEWIKSGGENGGYYPLHTKVAVSLEMATRINSEDEGAKVNQEPLENANFEWY